MYQRVEKPEPLSYWIDCKNREIELHFHAIPDDFSARALIEKEEFFDVEAGLMQYLSVEINQIHF